jgi:hypothetical protein
MAKAQNIVMERFALFRRRVTEQMEQHAVETELQAANGNRPGARGPAGGISG